VQDRREILIGESSLVPPPTGGGRRNDFLFGGCARGKGTRMMSRKRFADVVIGEIFSLVNLDDNPDNADYDDDDDEFYVGEYRKTSMRLCFSDDPNPSINVEFPPDMGMIGFFLRDDALVWTWGDQFDKKLWEENRA
jgi:hypothetical protein